MRIYLKEQAFAKCKWRCSSAQIKVKPVPGAGAGDGGYSANRRKKLT